MKNLPLGLFNRGFAWVVAAALTILGLSNSFSAFIFPLELERREGTVWLHVLTMKAGISIYNMQKVAYVNMNHGPLDPVFKFIIATSLPFLSPAMVTRFFVVLLPFIIVSSLRVLRRSTVSTLLLVSFSLYLLLLTLEPPFFLVGRSDVTATAVMIFAYLMQCGEVYVGYKGAHWGSAILAAMVFFVNWRFGPVVTFVWIGLVLEKKLLTAETFSFKDALRSVLAFPAALLVLLIVILSVCFKFDVQTYYRHFFGFFSQESGWGAIVDAPFQWFPERLWVEHRIYNGALLFSIGSAVFFPTRSTSRKIQLLIWMPVLSLLWITTCLAFYFNHSGGGLYYFGPFYVVAVLHCWRTLNIDKLKAYIRCHSLHWKETFSILCALYLLVGAPFDAVGDEGRKLIKSFPEATRFIERSKAIAGNSLIYSEDYFMFETRYHGERIDMGDVAWHVAQKGYFGPAFSDTLTANYTEFKANLPPHVLTGGLGSPELKRILELNYRPILVNEPSGWPNSRCVFTLYALK